MENRNHKLLLLLLVASLLISHYFTLATAESTGETTPQSGESQSGEEEEVGGEECEDYSIDWFVHQYNLRILSLPYLHIGLNVSLREAASSYRPQAAFKQLLDRDTPRRMTTEEVCASIPEHPQQHNDECPWTYTCTYDPHRFPAYVFEAECSNRDHREWTKTSRGLRLVTRSCEKVYYPVPMLHSSGCNPLTSKKAWSWVQEKIPVACVSYTV